MNSVAATVLLLALLGTASCGEPVVVISEVENVSPPPWAKVAPEQIAEAKKHGVPVAFENDLGMRFVLIPAGTFTMGSPAGEAAWRDDELQHQVTITQPFYAQTTEVTSGQYRRQEHAPTRHSLLWRRVAGDRQPAVLVTWQEAASFAQGTGEHDRGREYRLPTEAQWEYACRAGTATRFWFGEAVTVDQAHYDEHWKIGFGRGYPYPTGSKEVGSFPPNSWGLHDTHGNVSEWCQDWYGDYAPGPVTDPNGPLEGTQRVLRGGSWNGPWEDVRSASRRRPPSDVIMGACGFRLVSPLPEPTSSR